MTGAVLEKKIMTKLFEIKHRFSGNVLFSVEATSIKSALELAVKAGANLKCAYLRDAKLMGADLRNAKLMGADLINANLIGADLIGADLMDANLRCANLFGANLMDANLMGANFGKNVPITTTPLQLLGLHYDVFIFDIHIKIGCKLYLTTEWESFTDDEIAQMGGQNATKFWSKYKSTIIALAKEHQKSIEVDKAA